jgi:virginiamycin B lyase
MRRGDPRCVLLALLVSLATFAGCGPAESGDPSPNTATPRPTTSPPAALPALSLGGEAYSVAYGFGAAWVQVDPPVDELVKIVAKTGAAAPGVKGGSGVAIADDAIWVTVGEETLNKIDPQSGKILLTTKTPGAHYVSVGAGAVWVPTEGGITRVDPRTGAKKVIAIEAAITDLFATDDAVWASAKFEGLVLRLDPRSNSVVASIATGSGAHDLAVDDNGVWVTNYRDNSVSRIDPTTNTVAATIHGVGSGVGICACDGGIMVSTQGQGVSRIDPKTNHVTPVVSLNEWNYGIACGEGELWVSSVTGLLYRVPLS